MIYIVVRWLLLLCAVVNATPLTAQEKSVVIEIEILRKIPFVEFEVNGKKARFIIDTGASISLIDKEQIEEYGIEYYPDHGEGRIHGLGGDNTFNVTSLIFLSYDELFNVNHRFYSSDISVLKGFLSQKKIDILGILGTDFFLNHGVIIDYSQERLVILAKN